MEALQAVVYTSIRILGPHAYLVLCVFPNRTPPLHPVAGDAGPAVRGSRARGRPVFKRALARFHLHTITCTYVFYTCILPLTRSCTRILPCTLLQETEALQSEVRVLEDARSRLTREVGLKTELEAGYAARGARQAAALKEAQARIAALEGSLQQVGV